MSNTLINHSPDLKRLRVEGYEIELAGSYLLVHHVPYVNCNEQVKYGTLASSLELAGDVTTRPTDHVAYWIGDHPCDNGGSPLQALVNKSGMRRSITDKLMATCSFSQKPQGGYPNYYQKMTRYIDILEGHAHALDPDVSAKTFRQMESVDESAFWYIDNASGRYDITCINAKLRQKKIAIIGLGGTGSYVLDLVAKTPVEEIHLFDYDKFLQHNAFRAPGASSVKEILPENSISKVSRFTAIYSQMKKGIIPHSKRIEPSNVKALRDMDFVFVCVDDGESRRIVTDYLVENCIPFVDTGIGLLKDSEMIFGTVRIDTYTPLFHNGLKSRLPINNTTDNLYSTNIQTADINALTAALAVIKWKKLCGFYHDRQLEYNTVYQLITNDITNNSQEND